MPYPEEKAGEFTPGGDAYIPPCCEPGAYVPGETHITLMNEITCTSFVNSEITAELNVPDGAFQPTFNQEAIFHLYPTIPLTVEGDTHNWTLPVDVGDIVVDVGGIVIGGTVSFPPSDQPSIIATNPAHLYSTVKLKGKGLNTVVSQAMEILRLQRTPTDTFLANVVQQGMTAYGMYSSGLGRLKIPFFTYGELDQMVSGGGIMDWENLNDLYITKPNAETIEYYPYASMHETNVHKSKIWRQNVDLGLVTAQPWTLLQRGVQNGLNSGYSMKNIQLQIKNNEFLSESAENILFRAILASGVIEIMKLRTDYAPPYLPTVEDLFMQDPFSGLAVQANSHCEEFFIWERLATIQANRAWTPENPAIRESDVELTTAGTFDYTADTWTADAATASANIDNILAAQPQTGFNFNPGVFLAPGNVWQVVLNLDPLKFVYLLSKYAPDITDHTGLETYLDMLGIMPNIDLQIQMSGTKAIYDWS